jgi:tetratricopeptide (TPR) repeat protein
MTRGYFTEGSRLLAAALAADEEVTPLRARALVAAGALEVRLARPERIIGLAEEARTIHEALGDRGAVAAALLHRGVLEWTRSEYARARSTFEEALALAHELDEVIVAAASLHAQGVEAHSRGQDEEARRLMGEGLSLLARAPRDARTRVWATTIGLIIDRDAQGQPRMYFEDTLLLFRPVGPEAAAAYMLCNLALVARAQGDYDAAREALERALSLQRERDDPHGTAVALNGLGNLARSRDQFELGREWLEEALAIRRDVGDRRATAVTLSSLGLLAGRAGDLDGGRELIGRGLAVCRETEDGTGRSGLLLNLGNLELEAAADLARARSILEEAVDLYRAQVLMRGYGWPLCAFVDALITPPAPDEARARELIDEARGIFRGIDDVRGLAQVDALEARLEQGRGAAKAGADAR